MLRESKQKQKSTWRQFVCRSYLNGVLNNMYVIILIVHVVNLQVVHATNEEGQADFMNGLAYESTENDADWPGVEADWHTALEIKSNRICNLLPSHAKAAASSNIVPTVINGASNALECQRECEKK